MKHIIQTENYLLVVDDSDIKEGDYTFQEASNLILKYNNAYSKKIIAHLPLNNSPILEGVDLLPPIEDEVERLAEKYYGPGDYGLESKQGFIKGYNKAKAEYKYTEEDLRKAFMKGVSITGEGYNAEYAGGDNPNLETEFGNEANKYVNSIQQSIQQQKMLIGFESEIEKAEYWYLDGNKLVKPKTITNSQGINEWVGTYHY